MKVYAVWSGEYSDAIVHCVFVSEALAQGYIDALLAASRLAGQRKGDDPTWADTADKYSIEAYEVWDSVPALTVTEDGWDVSAPDGVANQPRIY